MADNFSAGLTDQDELSAYPSAANPLDALGIDPDMARANPALLASLGNGGAAGPTTAAPGAYDGPAIPASLIPDSWNPDADASATPQSLETPATPAPASSSAVAAGSVGGAAPQTISSPTDMEQAGFRTLSQNAQAATDAAGDIPTDSPEISRLTAQRGTLAQPQLYDPKTGKMVSQVSELGPDGQPVTFDPRPSTGDRIWRGVRGGLTGLLTSGIRGGLLGAIDPALEGSQAYGSPNTAFQKADAEREQKLASTNADIDTNFKTWKDAVDAAKAKAQEFRTNAGLGKDQVGAGTAMRTAATGEKNALSEAEKAAASTLQAQNDTPGAKASTVQQTIAQRQLQGQKLGLRGVPLARFAAGQAPEQFAPNAEITINQQAREAFKAQNGHYPNTPDEERTVRESTSPAAGAGSVTVDPNAPVSPAAQAVIDGRTALPAAGSRAPGAQQLRAEVFAHAPQYDETAFPNYKKTRESFTTGKQGDAVRAINQLDGHLQSAGTHVPDQSSFSPFNSLENAGRSATGTSRTNKFDVDVNGITGEWGKLVTGGVATAEEANRVATLLDHNQAPDKIRENLGEVRHLMETAKQRLQEQWQSGMPPGAVNPLSTLGNSGAPAGTSHDIVVNPEDMR